MPRIPEKHLFAVTREIDRVGALAGVKYLAPERNDVRKIVGPQRPDSAAIGFRGITRASQTAWRYRMTALSVC